jgi:hypothetical protein
MFSSIARPTVGSFSPQPQPSPPSRHQLQTFLLHALFIRNHYFVLVTCDMKEHIEILLAAVPCT